MSSTAQLEWRLPPRPMHPHPWQAWRVRDVLPIATRVMVEHADVRSAGTVTGHRSDLDGWLVPVITLDSGETYSSPQWGEMRSRVMLLLDEEAAPAVDQLEMFA